MSMLGTLVEISRFVNPHLLWLINIEDLSRRSKLEQDLAQISSFKRVKNLHPEQIVLINDGKWKRAIVRDITPKHVTYWLIDYGILLNYEKTVFMLPEEFAQIEPIAKQAALKNVVCIKQTLKLEIIMEHVGFFNNGSLKRFREHFQNATAKSFLHLEQRGSVHMGELYLKNLNGVWYNVAQILANENVVAFDKEVFEVAFLENTKKETAFMPSSTEMVTKHQHLLNHLEQQYPHRGRGRGIVDSQNLHSPGTSSERDVSKKNFKFERLDDIDASEATLNLDNLVKFERSSEDMENNLSTADSTCTAMSKLDARKRVLERLKKRKGKDSSETVDETSELDSSADSEIKLNLSNISNTSNGSTKGALKKMLALKAGRKSSESSENSFSTAKSSLGESSEEQKKLNLTKGKTPKKDLFKKLRELKAKQREGAEQNFSETSTDGMSQNEEVNLFESSASSSASHQSAFLDGDRRKCYYGKAFCECSICFGWRSTQLYYSNEKSFVDKQKKQLKPKPIERPQLLLKSSEKKIEYKVMKSYTTIVESKSRVQIACIPKVLVHGRTFPPPVASIASVPFQPKIQARMRKYEAMFEIQSYVWPALMRTMNVCMITSANRGKTIAYMPAVLSYLLESNSRHADLPKNSPGPIVLILCSNVQIAEEVDAVVADFLNDLKTKLVCSLAVPPIDKIFLKQFKANCDLLVTTPPMLVALLKSGVVSIQRVCHLVIENCDKILDTYFEDLNAILNIIQSMLTKRVCNNSVQVITTAECWTPSLKNLIKRLERVPVIYIGSFLEAALYGRAHLQLSFLQSKQKVASLINILDNNWQTKRTVVLFSENSEIDEVREHLQVKGIDAVCIYDYTSKNDVLEMEERWSSDTVESNKHIVLLCTDLVFTDTLNITNAFVLIHYSLPNRWTKFIARFGCLIESYQSPLIENKESALNRSEVHIFVDENCNEQFSRLLELLVRMGVKMSDTYCAFYKKLTDQRERNNIESEVKLCPKIKLFGECPSYVRDPSALTHQEATKSFISHNCYNRHMLSKILDKPNELPNCGTIKYKILRVKNVNCITARLLEWTDTKGKKHLIEQFNDLDMKLKEALQDQKITVHNVILNNFYVHVTQSDGTCSRCVVLQVTKTERITKRASMVLVRFLDTGNEWNVSTVDLYEMPLEFKLIPSQSVDICIANMVPPHLDDSWSKYCLTRVMKLFRNENCEDKGVYGISQILLRLSDVFWVDNVMLKEDLTKSNITVLRLNMKKSLLDMNLAIYSENQLMKLYNLCKEAEIVLPDYNLPQAANDVVVPSLRQATPQWAFLDPDDDCISVYSICIQNPDLFYVRLKKFDHLFMNLQKDIQEVIMKPYYKNEFSVEVGKFYLAKDYEGDEFCRVQIKSIDGDIVTCFYVDYGDFSVVNKAGLKFLPNNLITKLPFQAIECRLHGLAPVLNEWQDNAVIIMNHYIFEPKTTFFRTLYCNICATETPTNTEGKKYSVILVDYLKKQVVLVNKQLIDCGEAVSLEGENFDFNFVTFTDGQEESQDEEFDDVSQENYDCEQETQEENYECGHEMHEENCDNDEEPFFDFQIIKPELFISEVTGVKIPPPRAIASEPEPELPPTVTLSPMVALPPCEYSTPKVVWYQTNTHVKLNIELVGVEDFNLNVMRQRFLSFKTVCNDVRYQLDLQLFEKVASSYQTSNSGLQIRITLEKCTPGSWPRLLLTTLTMKNIKYDFSKFEVENDEDEYAKKILDFGSDFQDKLSDGENVYDYESGCDENDVSDVESLDL